jgi:aspartate ammonia-lyase
VDEIRTLLASAGSLAGIGAGTVELLAPLARRRTLRRGESLFVQGDPRRSLFLIASGSVAVEREHDGHSEVLTVLGAGEVLGEGALLHGSSHSASARAGGDAVVFELDREEVLARLAENGAAAVEVLSRVARAMNQRLLYTSASGIGVEKAYASGATRREHDLLGERDVPSDALYGIQTLRGVENFPITGVRLSHYPELVRHLAMVKQAAARANRTLGLLPAEIADGIDRACREVVDGHWHGHFVVDMIQGGAGTSTNMNANEVIANRALELLGRERGDYAYCHPNNHVNLSQSTNDVYPTAIRLATFVSVRRLLTALTTLRSTLVARSVEMHDVVKMGRTQLQDAVPMTLGQELAAWAVTTGEDIARVNESARFFLEVNLGGTAIGTGINADPRYATLAVEELRRITGLDVVLAENLVEATPDMGAFILFSGVLKRVAVKLSKMCNDLRLLSSGPRCGLAEINLPPMQPGSSIMPGKVNPVIPEVVNQVAFQVIGNDLTITMAAEAGQLQLNVMEPVIAFNMFQSIEILTAAIHVLEERCLRGITANRDRCRALVEASIGIVTAVVPALGYERASAIAKEALASGRSVREIILAGGEMEAAQLDELLSVEAMTRPRRMS